MASKTVEQWYEYLLAEKESAAELAVYTGGPEDAQSLFADISSRSKVAKWALWLWIVAVGARLLESLFDLHKLEVEATAAAAIAGNSQWLVQQVKLFELGNATLTVNTDRKVVYAVSNPADRIVAFAAVGREYGRAVVKVAKQDGDALPTPLTMGELMQLATYVSQVQYAGTKLAVVSREADKLKIHGDVYYNGLMNTDEVLAAVDASVKASLATAPFDSAISLQKLIDTIQKVDGVKDMVVQFYGRPNSSSGYGTALIGPIWLPYAGFAVLDDLDITLVAA